MVIADLADQFWLEGLPLVAATCTPATGAARGFPGKSGRRDERFYNLLQLLPLLRGKTGCESNVIELAFFVLEAE